MSTITQLDQDRIVDLGAWLEASNAHEGLDMSWAEVADAIGWPMHVINRVVRLVKEHPDESGFGLTVKRGRYPRIILSTGSKKLAGGVVNDVEETTRRGVVEAIVRLARYVATDSAHVGNTLNKRDGAHARHRNGFNHRRALLVNMQSELDASVPEESDAIDLIDELLSRM